MSEDAALIELLHCLKQRDYRFTAISPASHARVLGRPWNATPNLRDVFGWNRPFSSDDLPADLLELADRAGIIEEAAGHSRSRLRVAGLGDDLFLHSSFPTDSADAVFFGPDTYRFARFMEASSADLREPPDTIADMGAGSGAGAIVAARTWPESEVILVDINPAALRLASINAAAAGVSARFVRSGTVPIADLVIANPPYMIDPAKRSYRDGGSLQGGAVALDWVRQALAKLHRGGRMLLYTGAAYIDGGAPLIDALERECSSVGAEVAVEEIDPDVFGEELEQPAYAGVERIAAIGVKIRKVR